MLYRAVLRCLPASAHSWANGLRDRSLTTAVRAYTAAHESPSLLAAEAAAVQAAAVQAAGEHLAQTHSLFRLCVFASDTARLAGHAAPTWTDVL